MNAQQLTVEITKLQSRIERDQYVTEHLFQSANDDLAEIKARLNEVERRLHDLDKRIIALEKNSDLVWRLAPLVLSAVAILITFVKK